MKSCIVPALEDGTVSDGKKISGITTDHRGFNPPEEEQLSASRLRKHYPDSLREREANQVEIVVQEL